jgi:rubrerythrin
MSTSLFDGARLEIEYDEKFAVRKLTDDQEAVTLYGDTPAERLKTFNFAQWCDRAALCYRFCILCGMPMDPPEDTHPDWRCPVCAVMEATLSRRSYWENLKVGYSRDDRSRMGLELE